MADWVYCGSDSAVDAAGTQSLLRTHRAIWCSPPGLRPWPAIPQPEDRLWLVWRESPSSQTVLLLGGGRIEQAPRALFGTRLLWTNHDAPGLLAAAEQLGYKGGKSTSFLRLDAVVFPTGLPLVQGLADIDNRLNVATPTHFGALSRVVSIL